GISGKGVSRALRRREAHHREGGRHDPGCRTRLAYCHLERRGDRSALTGRWRGEPVLPKLPAEGNRQNRECALGWQRRDVRKIPWHAAWRPFLEQGIRFDVSDEPHRRDRSVRGLASWRWEREF